MTVDQIRSQPKGNRFARTRREGPRPWRLRTSHAPRGTRGVWPAVAAFGALGSASAAVAQPAWTVAAEYIADASGALSGGRSHAGRALDNLSVDVEGDLQRAVGWTGGAIHLSLLSNSGGQPNDIVGSLQGVDNIEVSRPRAKIYEAWIEQRLGPASVRVGLYDLNSEFYTNDAAGMLTSPAFGIGSELAATGPNGPSIFPSTAPAIRVRFEPMASGYIEAAALGARAGVIGDPGGVHFDVHDGGLFIVEAGWTGRGKLAIGSWRYSRRQDAYLDVDAAGRPKKRTAEGAYLLADRPLRGAEGDVRRITAFLRAGISDGETTSFRGGAQVGLLVNRVFSGRPASALSFGLNEGVLSSDFRRGMRAAGGRPARGEYYAELTYADQITSRLSLQPSLQYVRNVGGDRLAHDALVLTLRARVTLL